MAVGAFEDDGALSDLGVDGGDQDVGAHLFVLRGEGEGEREQGELGVAGKGELAGPGDVFGGDEVGLDGAEELELLEGGDGGSAVGGVRGVGDGDGANAGVGEFFDAERLQGGVFAGEEDEGAAGVGGRGSTFGEAGGDDAFGKGEVGGEKEVNGGAVEDLCGEGSGGAVADDEFDAGGLAVELGEGGEDGFEVGGGGDAQFFGVVLRGFLGGLLGGRVPRWDEEDGEGEEGRGKDWPVDGLRVGWGER